MEEVKKLEEMEVERFSRFERFIHWLTAVPFVYLFLSGLGMYSPKFAWLLSILGGGEFSAWLHKWAGVVFSFGVLLMFLKWAKDFALDSDDIKWLSNVKYYIRWVRNSL